MNELLSEAYNDDLKISVVQKTQKDYLPNGSEWPYGPKHLPEVVIQGHSMEIKNEDDD